MVGTASKPPFILLFVAGILSAVALAAFTFILVFALRHFYCRPKLESSDNAIALPALEEGSAVRNTLEFSYRGPSRLGWTSQWSAERAGEAQSPQHQVQTQPRTDIESPDDVPDPGPSGPQSFDQIANHVTTDGSERVGVHAERTPVISNLATLGNTSDKMVDRERSLPLVFPAPPTMPPLPLVPPMSLGRLSISTVWSQESMWPREKMPSIPIPPLAHIPGQATFRFAPIIISSSPTRRSTCSLPHSVGQSEFEDY
jgi:hypothetical protein